MTRIKRTIHAALLLTLALLMAACSKKVYVPVERTVVRTDSVAVHRADSLTRLLHTRDTLVIRDSITTTVRGDTVYKEAWRIRDRVSVMRDTLRIGSGFTLAETHRDTIRQPKIVEVENRVEVRAPLRWYQRALQWAGAAALLLPLLWLAARKNRR